MKTVRLAAIAFAALLACRPVLAADAKDSVQLLYDTLTDTMKNAAKLGFQGRYDKLAPVFDQVFDQALMTRLAVGPQWTMLTPDQQAKIVEAFKHLNASAYASNFNGYSGEQFQIEKETPIAGGDEEVDTKMVRTKDDPITFNYRMRQSGDTWKIIDIYLSGTVSQLANYRSEFSATLRDKGADGLVALIDEKIKGFTSKT